MTHEFDLSAATMLPPLGDTPSGTASAERAAILEARWDAVHDAADAVAHLAQLGGERRRAKARAEMADLPRRAAETGGWRSVQVATLIEDLAFVMQTGLRALIVTAGSGCDTTAAALTLWREFHAARDAICEILEHERLAA